jgi:DNA polymerase III epsilon subunit-like protein
MTTPISGAEFGSDGVELEVNNDAIIDEVAVATLWGGVRIIVIDIETTKTPDKDLLRAISIATVTCRGGSIRNKWQTLVNAQMPIDRESRRIHGIADEHLEGEPIFADVAQSLAATLTAADGEKVILAVYNARFDVAVLRTEFEAIHRDIPFLPIIDLQGKLAGLVGVHPAVRGLKGLLAELGIINDKPHEALADAVATAEALIELLARAASAGHTDFDQLLATISGDLTTTSINPGHKSIGPSAAVEQALPPEHILSHASVLSARAGSPMFDKWQGEVAQCALLRCRHLDDRVIQAGPGPVALLQRLEAVLAQRCDAGDAAGAATVLGAMLPLLPQMKPPTKTAIKRTTGRTWTAKWAPKFNALGRCTGEDLCPACRRREACPLDIWPETIATLVVSDPAKSSVSYLQVSGKDRGTGSYVLLTAKGEDPRLVGAALWIVVNYWSALGQHDMARHMVHLAWSLGCRYPEVVEAYAGYISAPGRLPDLQAALDACDAALAIRDESTTDGWMRLASRRNQIAGHVQRLEFRPSGQLDGDGNPIPLRRHHPENPVRTRQPRFMRQG